MKIANSIICSILILVVRTMSGQNSSLVWERSYGSSWLECSYDIQHTTDGGYVVVGSSELGVGGDVSEGFGSLDFWVIKISPEGDLQWEKSYGGTQYDVAYSVKQTVDGGYIVAGTSLSNNIHVSGNHGAKDFWVIKLSATGEIEWQQNYGGPGDDIPYEIECTSDGGYIIAGLAYAVGGDVTEHFGLYDGWIVKISSTGELQWQKSFGGSQHDLFKGIKRTYDGGYIVSGQSRSSDGHLSTNYGESDLWVLKLDQNGTMEWQRVLGGSGSELGSKVLITNTNQYIIAGYTDSSDGHVSNYYGMGDFWVVKLDADGTIIWDKNYGGSSSEILENASHTNDGGFILCGFSRSSTGDVTHFNGGLGDYWIMKANAEGELEWQISVGGSDIERAYDAIETADGGIIATGYTESSNGDVSNLWGISDVWVVKVAGPNGLGLEEDESSQVKLFPNPTNDHLTITNLIPNSSIVIRNLLGEIVYSVTANSTNYILSTALFAPGIYIVDVAGSRLAQKLIVVN
jgi:hypothetical protein